jgi:hypothetical protein
MELDVVVLDGEPENQPAMFGSSSAAENFVSGNCTRTELLALATDQPPQVSVRRQRFARPD